MNLIAGPRREYISRELIEEHVDPDPLAQFILWFGEAEAAQADQFGEANAMTLATASPDGVPSARTVLLKGYSERGFIFYSNYESAKGRDLAANPRAALLFYWAALERQIRIVGNVARLSRADSERYFLSRPLGARLGAAVSRQSEVIPNREWLAEAFAAAETTLGDGEVVLPTYWGGYLVIPESYEFWQGRPNRLHDRLRYKPGSGGSWIIERLCP
ncbi:MAG: pyridoxamine 5'-phosphate oxidase [Chloroflexota bacterium]|nr:pyridoxamine 5'-phosphate oxidase [Chloroflexota bacterium]